MKECFEYMPVIENSGFRMDGYYVWCGSAIKENGIYYLFASRWTKKKTFPDGYMTDSEIVLATTDDISKPFKFEKVVLGKRDGNYWDSMMSHNPYIMKYNDKYVLFYIGTSDGSSKNRAVGYATSDSITGEWVRSDKPINLPNDSNNPCVVITPQGKVLLYYRNGSLQVSVAEAESIGGEYEILNFDLFKRGKIEDMFVYHNGSKYVMIAEDADGVYTGLEKGGVKFLSDDGIHWDENSAEPTYGFDISYNNGKTQTLQRRERPMILFDEEKKYLFTTAKINGEEKLIGGDTWNMVQEII